MTRLQKVAVWNIAVMLTAMLTTLLFVPLFPGKGIVFTPMAIMIGLFFGEKMFKGDEAPRWDEMEQQIGRRASFQGYTLFWIVIILLTTFIPLFKVYRGVIPIVYLSFFPLFAAYLLMVTISLSMIYQVSSYSSAKKIVILVIAVIILLLPPVATKMVIADNLLRRSFTGSDQRDEWHFNSTEEVVADSVITLKTFPPNTKKMYITLAYFNGRIEKAILSGQEIKAENLGVGAYYLYLPESKTLKKGDKIKITWKFPAKNLIVKNSYRTRIRSLVPVDRIWLSGIIDKGSGYMVPGHPEQKKFRVVWNCGTYLNPATNFGSCDLTIKKITAKRTD